MKVLVITGTMNVGGIENQLMHFARKADKNLFQIDFTSTECNPHYKSEIESLGGKCIYIPNTDGWHFIRYCRALYKVIKDGKYDIVYSHELFHSGMVVYTAKLAGVKNRFVHAHNWGIGDSLNYKQSIVRRIYNKFMRHLMKKYATKFFACSSYAGEFLYGKEINENPNYHVIFNSVDTAKFLDNYDKAEYGEFCNDGWTNVIQVGRFSVVKNQLFTVEVANVLRNRGNKIRILCAGNNGNDYEDKVREKIKEYGLEEYVLLLGIRNDVDTLLRKSSAFFMPSMYEGMPLVLIEAQASGIPCVIADTFSHEVDYNIGLIKWLDITYNAEVWATELEKAVNKKRADKKDVVNAIEKYGFDSETFAKKICQYCLESN